MLKTRVSEPRKVHPIPPLVSVTAKERMEEILSDLTNCKMPVPEVIQNDTGFLMTWENLYCKIGLSISDTGTMGFLCENSEIDLDGDLVRKEVLEGYLENTKGIGVLMSWLLQAETKEA